MLSTSEHPERSVDRHVRPKGVALSVALLALFAFPVWAMAQTNPQSFEPSSQDMTRWIIAAIFGDWNTGSKVPMLGAAMEVLNIFALTFGTLMFTYVAVVGTLNTAQDGELLGRKWSSMWIPVRYTLGTALLVPLASGYSTVQHAILWLALAGGGAASQVWSAAMTDFAGSQATTVLLSQDYAVKVADMAREILKAEICVQANQAARSVGGMSVPFDISEKSGAEGTLNDDMMGEINSYKRTIRWGAVSAGNTSGQAVDSCGKVTTSAYTDISGTRFEISPSSTKLLAHGTYANGSMGDTDADFAANKARGRAFIDAQANGIWAAAARLRPLAIRMAAGTGATGAPAQAMPSTAEIATELKNAASAYKAILMPAAQTIASSFDQRLAKFTDASKDAGWLMAGSTFFQMAQMRSSATKMMQSVPAVSGVSVKDDGAGRSIDEVALRTDIDALGAQVDSKFKEGAGEFWNPGLKLAAALGKLVSFDPASDKHALVQIKDTGDGIIVGTEVIATATLAAATTAFEVKNNAGGRVLDLVSGIPSTIKDLLGLLTPAIYTAFITSFGIGITMAFVIPMLPFTMTVGAIVGWLMALFSAVVAGPIWVAGHLHPEGDDIAGKGVGGYMILLETVTRPIFVVFGLIGAFLIMDPILKLVAVMFRANMSALESNSTTGVVSVFMLAVLYVSIVLTTVRSSMTLVYVLSETVYRWIGGAHAGLEQARDFTSQAGVGAQAATAGLQGVGSAVAAARKAQYKAKTEQSPKDKTV